MINKWRADANCNQIYMYINNHVVVFGVKTNGSRCASTSVFTSISRIEYIVIIIILLSCLYILINRVLMLVLFIQNVIIRICLCFRMSNSRINSHEIIFTISIIMSIHRDYTVMTL